jgi:hypothetical protein
MTCWMPATTLGVTGLTGLTPAGIVSIDTDVLSEDHQTST